jgi:hypothetical protein
MVIRSLGDITQWMMGDWHPNHNGCQSPMIQNHPMGDHPWVAPLITHWVVSPNDLITIQWVMLIWMITHWVMDGGG